MSLIKIANDLKSDAKVRLVQGINQTWVVTDFVGSFDDTTAEALDLATGKEIRFFRGAVTSVQLCNLPLFMAVANRFRWGVPDDEIPILGEFFDGRPCDHFDVVAIHLNGVALLLSARSTPCLHFP